MARSDPWRPSLGEMGRRLALAATAGVLAAALFVAGCGAPGGDAESTGETASSRSLPHPNQRPSSQALTIDAAIEQGKVGEVVALLRLGVPVDVRGVETATPLMIAAQVGDLEITEALIEHGADVDARDYEGMTALMFAAEADRPEIVRCLLRAGAFVDARARGSASALYFAAANGSTRTVLVLLEADPQLEDDSPRGPRAIAEQNGHHQVAQILREAAQSR